MYKYTNYSAIHCLISSLVCSSVCCCCYFWYFLFLLSLYFALAVRSPFSLSQYTAFSLCYWSCCCYYFGYLQRHTSKPTQFPECQQTKKFTGISVWHDFLVAHTHTYIHWSGEVYVSVSCLLHTCIFYNFNLPHQSHGWVRLKKNTHVPTEVGRNLK